MLITVTRRSYYETDDFRWCLGGVGGIYKHITKTTKRPPTRLAFTFSMTSKPDMVRFSRTHQQTNSWYSDDAESKWVQIEPLQEQFLREQLGIPTDQQVLEIWVGAKCL